jgi:exonuclease SbcD
VRARFLHLADCHLGYRQYGRNERFNDFSKAFYAVMDVAVAEKVDFVVLAGDLFQKRSIDALTLSHAMRGLEKLQRAGIPCLAVEGNHELAYFNESIGWMRFLAERELLVLLDTTFDEGKPLLEPYTKRNGAYIDVKPGLRRRVYNLHRPHRHRRGVGRGSGRSDPPGTGPPAPPRKLPGPGPRPQTLRF